jgi:hypothetical protein
MAAYVRLLCLIVWLFNCFITNAQHYVQEIRGIVSDAHTGISLPGATVILQSGESSASKKLLLAVIVFPFLISVINLTK